MGGELDRDYLLASVQRALLGAAGDSLCGLCADLQNGSVVLTWYVRPGMPQEERDDLEIAGTEVIADFPAPFTIDERFVEVVDPSSALRIVGEWVFLRRGFTVTG